MRYLGIDYGTKRVGVAVSDESGTIAFPFAILDNSVKVVSDIKTICAKEYIGTIVVGESMNYKGQPNPVMAEIEQLIAGLREATSIPVVREREFLSTQQARFFQPEKERVDDSAAAIILQSYLDKLNVKPMDGTV